MKTRLLPRLSVAVALILLLPLSLPTSSVSASLGEGGQGPGIGGPGSGSRPGPDAGSTTSVCTSTVARGFAQPGNTLRSVFFPRCVIPGAAWNYSRWVCPVGFTAMRFWGDENTLIRGYTISQVNYTDEDLFGCGSVFAIGSSPRSMLFPYHPDDAGPAAGGSWRASSAQRRYSSAGIPAVYDFGFLRGNAVRTAFGSAGGGGYLYGTETPFARGPLTNHEPCTALQTSVVSDLINDPEGGAGVRLGVARAYMESRRSGQNHSAALVTANLSSVSARIRALGDRSPGMTRPAMEALVTEVAVGEVVPDNVPCSSALDFVPQPGATATHYGACYAPIVAPAWGYAPSSTNPNGAAASYMVQYAPSYESWTWAANGGFSESATHPTTQAAVAEAKAALAQHLRLNYFLGGERAAQLFAGPSVGEAAARSFGAGNANALPDNRVRLGQSGAAAGQYWERAAQSLQQHARCTVNRHNPLVSESVETVTPNPDGIRIVLNAPRYGQVGGQERPSTVTAVADLSVLCGGRPCRGDVRINSLRWDLVVAGAGSYSPCVSAVQLGCEYRVHANSISSRNVKTFESYTLHFYNATGRSEAVSARVTGISVQAEKRTIRTYTVRVPVDPTNPNETYDVAVSEEVWVPVSIPVSVVDGRTGRDVTTSGLSFRVVLGTPSLIR